MKINLLLVGCGNMGFAMLKGWLAGQDQLEAWVVEPNEALRQRAAKAGANTAVQAGDLPEGYTPDLIFMAVKPQVMGQVLPDYKPWSDGHTTFVSIAAGITLNTFAQALSPATPIIRCMPNTPAAIGAGAMVCYANDQVTPPAKQMAEQLLACSGDVSFIESESLMDAVTAVSGSGPAYIFHFIEALAKAGQESGLPEDLAQKLALQTVYGSALLAKQSDDMPATLREQVTSPGGTTAAALGVLMGEDRLSNLLTDAVNAAAKRSVELSKG